MLVLLGMVGAVVLAGLAAQPSSAQADCSVDTTQTHRGITATFTECLDRDFTHDGTDYTVHVYYTETNTSADNSSCTSSADNDGDGVPDLQGDGDGDGQHDACEHALDDDDNAAGDNVDAVVVGEETERAWRFYLERDIQVVPSGNTEMTVYIGDDRRGGGIPSRTSLWWDDEWVDGGDVLRMRLLAFHEQWHLVQWQNGGPGGAHSEGVARAIEDRVEEDLDADTGHLFIPEFDQYLATEGPSTTTPSGGLSTPRGRADSLEQEWYWSSPWWTWLFDQQADPSDTDPTLGWDFIESFYDELPGAATEFDALDDALSPSGTSFRDEFLDFPQALFAYEYTDTNPRLDFLDDEVNAATNGLRGHTVRSGNPSPATDVFNMNPRSSRHVEYRTNTSCDAVTFGFDGNGTNYGWSVLSADGSDLADQTDAFGSTWDATVLTSAIDRVVGAVTAVSGSGSVNVDSGCVTPTLEIEKPTTSSFAVVGPAADPRRLVVRVDVDGPEGDPVRGLRADDFEVVLEDGSGTELSATVLSAADVQSDYWILVDPPDAADGASDGAFHDLVVRLGSADARQDNSVLYADQGDQDVEVVLDRSGSMGGTTGKMEAAQNAGELLVNELADSDQGAFVAFDDAADLREALAEVGSGTHRDDLQDAIEGESAGGATSIGAGMRTAADDHDANGDADHRCSFVLLSDGAENTDPRWADVRDEVADNGCALHTIGLGPQADEPLLQQIATAAPGGSYHYAGTGEAPVGSGSGGSGGGSGGGAAGGATTWENGVGAIYDTVATAIGDRERLRSTGFEEPAPPVNACLDDTRTVDFDDAEPSSITVDEQMTADGVTFTGRLFTNELAGVAQVDASDRLVFDELDAEAAEPACEVTFAVDQTGQTLMELLVNGHRRTGFAFEDFDGLTVDGVEVSADRTGDTQGTITLSGELATWGFGGETGEAGTTALRNVEFTAAEEGGVPVHVDESSDRLVVSTSWQERSFSTDTRLFRPDGSEADTGARRDNRTFSNEVWTIDDPAAGTWRLQVQRLDAPHLVTASAVTDLSLDLLLEPTTERVDEAVTGVQVPVVAAFTGDDGPVVGADVTAAVVDPTGFRRRLTLHDDGDHGDGAAGDGIYGNWYTATSFGDEVAEDPADGEEPDVAGSYRVEALGVRGDDRREDSGAFALARGADSDGDGLPDEWEDTHGLDPDDPADADSDSDRDGNDARCEFQVGTDPRNSDSDGGGERDGAETVTDQDGICRPGDRDPLDPDDDRVSPITVVTVEPRLGPDDVPEILVRWGDPEDDADDLVTVDIWRQPIDPETGSPTGPWERIADDVDGNDHTDTDVDDGDVFRYQVDPVIRSVDGDLVPARTETSAPTVATEDPHPPEGTILIDDDAPTTTDRVVDLDLTVDDTSQPGHGAPDDPDGPVPGSGPADIEMRLANGSTVPEDTDWRPFEPTVDDWDLGAVQPGDTAVVTVQFRDARGNVGSGGLGMADSIEVVDEGDLPGVACPEGQVPEDGFGDVPESNVHEANIDCIVWWEIALGKSADVYAPAEGVRRDQMASFIARLLDNAGVALSDNPEDHFADDDGNVHEERINQLAELGVVRGTSSTTYTPAVPIPREQMATFLVRAFETATDQTLSSSTDFFTDDDTSFHEDNINNAAEAGFTAGKTETTFAPKEFVRRDQMASFLKRILDTFTERGDATPPSAG